MTTTRPGVSREGGSAPVEDAEPRRPWDRRPGPWSLVVPVILLVAGLVAWPVVSPDDGADPDERSGPATGVELPRPPPPRPPVRPASDLDHALGVYRGAGKEASVVEFEEWLGREVPVVVDFVADDSWRSIEAPEFLTAWARERRLALAVPLIPRSGGSLEQGARGAYNRSFERLGRFLVDHGHEDAILRLGWEFNGGWYRWAAREDPEAFVGYWRQVVDTMRSVPGARFRFDWNPTLGRPDGDFPAEEAYPGDDYVDLVGLDVYDQSWLPDTYGRVRSRPDWWAVVGGEEAAARRRRVWQEEILLAPRGLEFWRDFAAERGKPLSIPEWGVAVRKDGHGGGDNALFVERMAEWIGDNRVAYAAYFDYDARDGRHRLSGGELPDAAAAFRRRFG